MCVLCHVCVMFLLSDSSRAYYGKTDKMVTPCKHKNAQKMHASKISLQLHTIHHYNGQIVVFFYIIALVNVSNNKKYINLMGIQRRRMINSH